MLETNLALLPHTSVTLILVDMFRLFLIAPKDYLDNILLPNQSTYNVLEEGYSRNVPCVLNFVTIAFLFNYISRI